LFGDGGMDELVGGSGNDVLIGDYGRVLWRSSDNIFSAASIEAIAGQGGYGDFTDGVIRTITDVYSVTTDEGGNDDLTLGEGDDVGIGGASDDTVRGDGGNDIIVSMICYLPYLGYCKQLTNRKLSIPQFGDSAKIVYYLDSTSPKSVATINCSDGGNDNLYGGSGVVDFMIGGAYNDTIKGNDGMDLVFGDHAQINLFELSHKLRYAKTASPGCSGGDDLIVLGAGDDLVSIDQY
jgi:Ca2+-binding RTX toxin-like protein